MEIKLIKEGGYEYIEEGSGPCLLLLHGLFGEMSNWMPVLNEFRKDYKVIIPLMPIYQPSKVEASVDGLADFISGFIVYKNLNNIHLLGNSLGGHIALICTLENPDKFLSLILTGSSGLFETGMGTGFPRRSDYDYIKDRIGYTFYDPETATQDLLDEVFDIVNDNRKALRILYIARAAQRHNMRQAIRNIHTPTLLIWGLNDNITPTNVAHEFNKLMPNSSLKFIDQCAHAPMMEQPVIFNKYVRQFLGRSFVV